MAGKKHRGRSKPIHQVKMAKERMGLLFEQAENAVKKNPNLASRYVEMARRLGMRYNVRIPPQFRKRICKQCKSYLSPGITSAQKTEKGWVIITCKVCGKKNRYSLAKAKRKRR